MDPLKDFEWWRDPKKGYSLSPSRKVEVRKVAKRSRTLTDAFFAPEGGRPLEIEKKEEVIGARAERGTGELSAYRPLSVYPELRIFRNFVNNVCSEETALAFINTFGPLTVLGIETGEYLEPTLQLAQKFREIKHAHQHGLLNRLRELIGDGFTVDRNLQPLLVLDRRTNLPRISMTGADLRSLLFFQLAESISGGRVVRECEFTGCGKWFEAGPGTGRRADSHYCSPDHQKASHNKGKAK